MTKSEALELVSDLGAIEAVEELSGMLSLAIEDGRPKDIKPLTAAIKSLDRDLETWAELERKKQRMAFADHVYAASEPIEDKGEQCVHCGKDSWTCEHYNPEDNQ